LLGRWSVNKPNGVRDIIIDRQMTKISSARETLEIEKARSVKRDVRIIRNLMPNLEKFLVKMTNNNTRIGSIKSRGNIIEL